MSALGRPKHESSLGEEVAQRPEGTVSAPGRPKRESSLGEGIVSLPDRHIAYRLDGGGDGPVVMLAHGLLADLSLWDDVVARLAGAHRILRYDLRGHGGSSATPAPYTLAMLADDAVALLDALAIERVHFVGTSIGGMIGQQLGLAHGGRLASLVLAHTAARQPAPRVWHERIAMARRQGLQALAEPAVQRWLTPAAQAARPELLAHWTARAAAIRVDGYMGCAAAIAGLDFADCLADIRTPALVVSGAQDEAIAPELCLELRRGLPNAAWTLLDPAAHQSALECPERLAAACAGFWAALPPTTATASRP
ncbi:MAG: alpha/beta fold hydrolase [Pigmentiphaga sp.]|nr:alpha/beta fold hydrolase [Pigmentiphaga sp.]